MAVVESSRGSPFVLSMDASRDVRESTSRGTGLLVAKAMEDPGIDQVVVALGGTGCLDGGMGFLEAVEAEFYDRQRRRLEGRAKNLMHVHEIKVPRLPKPLTGLYDTFVPLLGLTGAVALYGPQKGVSVSMQGRFEEALEHYAQVVQGSRRVVNDAGTGAAGGIGFAIKVAEGTLEPGARRISEWMKLGERIKNADWIITGEGRLDRQSLLGKVVGTVLEEGKRWHKPVVAVVGSYPLNLTPFYERGLTSVWTLVPGPTPLEESIENTAHLLQSAGENLGRMLVRGNEFEG